MSSDVKRDRDERFPTPRALKKPWSKLVLKKFDVREVTKGGSSPHQQDNPAHYIS